MNKACAETQELVQGLGRLFASLEEIGPAHHTRTEQVFVERRQAISAPRTSRRSSAIGGIGLRKPRRPGCNTRSRRARTQTASTSSNDCGRRDEHHLLVRGEAPVTACAGDTGRRANRSIAVRRPPASDRSRRASPVSGARPQHPPRQASPGPFDSEDPISDGRRSTSDAPSGDRSRAGSSVVSAAFA